MRRIGIDVGGTFTDLVAIDEAGRTVFAKSPSTPQDQSIGVMAGLDALTTATLFAIYIPAVLLFSLVIQFKIYRRLQAMQFDAGYLRAYSIGRGLTLLGFAALLLSL